MSSESELARLRALAAACGIQTVYLDASRVRRVASADSLRAVLAAVLGRDAIRPQEELRRLRSKRDSSMLPPVSVAWKPGKARIALRPGSTRSVAIEVEDEAGAVRGWKAGLVPAGDGVFAATLPDDLAPGYYRLHARAGRLHGSSFLICAPRRAYRNPLWDRAWGAFLPLYALHSRRSPAIGDFTDLRDLSTWIADLGGSAVATLPILAQFYQEPLFEPSPYAPASRLMWNELYIDLAPVPESRSPLASIPESPPRHPAGDYVDYAALYAAKRAAIERLRPAMTTARRAELDAFCRSNPQVAAYDRFRSLTDRDGPWTEWPGSQETSQSGTAPGYHAYAQWLADSQVGALASETRGGVYLDLPLGVHPASFDTWRWPECFVRALNAGAPPDPLATGGQDWGFPPLHPQANRENSYEYVIAFLRHHLRYASRLRIDHVMGLHRLFVIPRGAPAAEGVYLRYAADELYAILCLESHRYRTEIVGENLGTVPAYVNEAMQRHGFSGMYVLPFEIDIDGGSIRRPGPDSAASLNTHDLPTFAGWWSSLDIHDRLSMGLLSQDRMAGELEGRRAQKETLVRYLVEQGLLSARSAGDAGDVRDALLRFLGGGPARLALASLEDLWDETRPQNVPGTSRERPNWRRRARLSLEEMKQSPRVLAALSGIDAGRRQPALTGG